MSPHEKVDFSVDRYSFDYHLLQGIRLNRHRRPQSDEATSFWRQTKDNFALHSSVIKRRTAHNLILGSDPVNALTVNGQGQSSPVTGMHLQPSPRPVRILQPGHAGPHAPTLAHRRPRSGDRNLNAALPRIASQQAHLHLDAKALMAGGVASGDSGRGATPILERRLSDVVHRALDLKLTEIVDGLGS